MRIGSNPEKEKNEKNLLKQHRVVMVFYVPNSDEEYYKELHKVLDKSLESLVKTINFETTVITLINNNSTLELDVVVNKYIKHIDKYVCYSENKGKVHAVINEVRGVYEPFVTITDADVLFYSGWEKAVFSIFKTYPKAGVVSPLPVPHCSFGRNSVLFFDGLFSNLKYGSILSSHDTELYKKSIDNPEIFRRQWNDYWDVKQLYLDGIPKAIVGATHFVATYKTKLFRNHYEFPEFKFKAGYEDHFMDVIAENKGMYRLSTTETFAYHIGNSLDEVTENHSYSSDSSLTQNFFNDISCEVGTASFMNRFKKLMGKAMLKYKWSK
jgi:hypothetical protein